MLISNSFFVMIYDISIPLSVNTELYPGDRPFKLSWESELKAGLGFALSSFEMSSHFGTHIDAPSHFIKGGLTIAELPPDIFYGPAIVIDCQGDYKAISSSMIAPFLVYGASTRILIKTMDKDKYLTSDAVDAIISSGCKLLGIDQLCLEEPEDDSFPVHKALLSAGISIIECLDLSRVSSGQYLYSGAPLPIVGAEAAPVRAFLID